MSPGSPLNSPASTPPSTLAGQGGPSASPPPDASGGPQPGGEGGEGEGQGAASPLRRDIQMARKMEMDMMELSQRYPSAAPSLRAAATAIRAALRSIIANPGQPEPRSPNLGG